MSNISRPASLTGMYPLWQPHWLSKVPELLLLLVVRLFFPTGDPHMAKFLIGNGVVALSDMQRDKSDRPPIAHSLDIMRFYLQKRRAGGTGGARGNTG